MRKNNQIMFCLYDDLSIRWSAIPHQTARSINKLDNNLPVCRVSRKCFSWKFSSYHQRKCQSYFEGKSCYEQQEWTSFKTCLNFTVTRYRWGYTTSNHEIQIRNKNYNYYLPLPIIKNLHKNNLSPTIFKTSSDF